MAVPSTEIQDEVRAALNPRDAWIRLERSLAVRDREYYARQLGRATHSLSIFGRAVDSVSSNHGSPRRGFVTDKRESNRDSET